MRVGKKKSTINLLAAARKKRRRDRWLVGGVIVASLLVPGYSFAETQQVKVEPVIQPTIRPSPQVVEGDEPLEIERSARAAPMPAPEESCDDPRVLVDRSHALPPDYVPEDLDPLWAYGIPTLGGGEMLLRREAAKHLGRLVNDAAADGEELVVASAYRSYAHQQASYARLTSI